MTETSVPATVKIQPPDTAGAVQIGAGLLERANALVVNDEESHAEAQIALQDIKRNKTIIVNELFKEPRELAHKTWKAMVASQNKVTDPFDEAKKIITRKVVTHEKNEADKAEKERKRLEAEQKARDDEAALKAAEEAQAAGDPITAEEILEQQATAPAPVVHVEQNVSKVRGVTSVTRWHAEFNDKLATLKHVIEHPEHLEGVELVPKYWNGLARTQKKAMSIPGVKAVSETTKSVSG